MPKIGNNDLCWCGSGKKYKKCHRNREQTNLENANGMTIDELFDSIKTNLSKKICFHPDAGSTTCSGGIIKAHTIQKSFSLESIAVGGHVYSIQANIFTKTGAKHPFELKNIGINQASTFSGFCRRHDDELFKPIESSDYDIGNFETLLFGYRAVCRELYTKTAQKELIPSRNKFLETKSLSEEYSSHLKLHDIAVEEGLTIIRTKKQEYDRQIKSEKQDDNHYLAFILEKLPEFVCSGALYPWYGFNGEILQTAILGINPIHYNLLTITIAGTPAGKGLALIQWLGNSNICTQIADQLQKMDSEDVGSAFSRLVFQFLENVYFSPNWWDNLPSRERNALFRRASTTGMLGNEHNRNCLTDDNHRPIRWKIEAIKRG